jgi:hypothetical protein
MASATRVACDKESDGDGSKSDGNEGGGQVTATRAMVTEGKQRSTSDSINKGGWWLAREHQRGDHDTTTTVGDNEQRERAADDDGSDEEGKGGKGNGDSSEGGGQQRGRGQ